MREQHHTYLYVFYYLYSTYLGDFNPRRFFLTREPPATALIVYLFTTQGLVADGDGYRGVAPLSGRVA
jgi:hypothetical protein